jgi:hypothetical protein
MDRELQDDNRRGHFDSYIDHFDEADRVVLRVTDHPRPDGGEIVAEQMAVGIQVNAAE